MDVAAGPANWIWADGPVAPGPAVLVDVDGVVSNASARQHHLQGRTRDWKSFFAAADLDEPIDGSVQLLEHFDTALTVVLLTARPHYLVDKTVGWLGEHGYRWELLIIRDRSDGGLSSPEFKRRSVREIRAHGYDPRLALDDDRRNIEMFRAEGVPALYIHSGYYEA